MKKATYIFLILAIVFSLVSCDDNQEQVDVFEYEKELTNLTEIMNGEDILRYPEKYDDKQIDFCVYVFDYTESTISITPIPLEERDIATVKEGGAFIRALRQNKYMPIDIPYTNNKSPRLLIGDCITFTGTVHTKLVDGEVSKKIDNITNVKIIDNKK